jgi:cell division protein FtsA
MLKHLPQLMKFKMAMDVRIGMPNEHLAGSARNEINQPMYATSVGLIMRGFEYLDTYKKSFNAETAEKFISTRDVIPAQQPEQERAPITQPRPVHDEEKIPLTEKIKSMLTKMFEVEDQPIK